MAQEVRKFEQQSSEQKKSRLQVEQEDFQDSNHGRIYEAYLKDHEPTLAKIIRSLLKNSK